MPISGPHSTSRRLDGRRVLARAAFLAGVSLCVVLSGPTTASAEYLLGPQDKVRLKVYEWRPSRDEIFEWTALNDQFTIGAGGELLLPFAGSVEASGTTPDELAGRIGNQLRDHMDLARPPDVSVEVVQFRPFYIVGQVMQSGEFPFRPNLTVLQAVSIAGGLRTREENLSRLEREVIIGQGDVDLLQLNYFTLLGRKARLESELASKDEISFPKEITDRQANSAIVHLMDQERSVFDARRDGVNTQTRALSELKDFLQSEGVSLEKQLTLFDRQIELMQKELDGVSSLVSKGLTAETREMALQRNMAEIQGSRLSVETAMLRARQETSRTDISILELHNQRMNEITIALRETQAELDGIGRKSDTAVQLLHESEMAAPRLLALRAQALKTEPVYTIIRPSKSGLVEIAATEATNVEPGDTVKIEIPLPPGLDDFQSNFGSSTSDDLTALTPADGTGEQSGGIGETVQ